MTDETNPVLNPWHPETDILNLKVLEKLGEELNECGAAVSRCIIQGINEKEPITGKLNKEWLEDEVADVYANISLAIARFGLDKNKIEKRMLNKIAHLLSKWHRMHQMD